MALEGRPITHPSTALEGHRKKSFGMENQPDDLGANNLAVFQIVFQIVQRIGCDLGERDVQVFQLFQFAKRRYRIVRKVIGADVQPRQLRHLF